MRIHLHISLFPQRDPARARELATCLQRNLENPLLASVNVLDEGGDWPLLSHSKVRRIPTRSRPRFSDFLPHLSAEAINILSNNDIHFDSSLGRLSQLWLGEKDFLALTRREPDGSLFRAHKGDSQDTWIFRGRPSALARCDFFPGTPGCDTRLAYLFEEAGYRTLNPGKVIHCWHLHASTLRAYDDQKHRVHGMYLLEQPLSLLEFYQRRALKYLLHRLRNRLLTTHLASPAAPDQAATGQPSEATPAQPEPANVGRTCHPAAS
jgi:hypothetical protein